MMTAGPNICIHLWGMRKAYSFAQNEASSISRRGLGQLKLRQFPRRTIRTICQTTVPSRSTLKLRKQGPVAASNGSTIKKHRLATGAHYSTRHGGESSTSPAPEEKNAKLDRFIDNLLSDDVPINSASHGLHNLQSGADVVRRAKHIFGGEDGESKQKFRAFAELSSVRARHKDILSDLQTHEDSLSKESQPSDTSQIGTMLLPIQDGLLPTINKDARTALEDANQDVVWTEAYFAKQDIIQPQDSPRSSRYASAQRMKELLQSKHRIETCDDPIFKALTKNQMSLPVRRFSKQILDLIDSNTYSIIAANQRSGKSTQVPQIIFDDAIETFTGNDCNILCVQATAQAAFRLGQRVADERLETTEDTVKWKCWIEPAHTGGTITYCSLLNLKSALESGPSILQHFSHIIIDDIHSFSNELNVIMMILKQFIDQRKSIGAHVPKVIMMGAMIDIDFFGSYFGSKDSGGTLIPAPHLAIPGNTFHVKKHYLGEVLSDLAHSLPREILNPLLKEDPTTEQFLRRYTQVVREPDQIETKRLHQGTCIACGLISATILSLLSTTKAGSILVFVTANTHSDEIRKHVTTFGLKLGLDFANKDQFRFINLQTDLRGEQTGQVPKLPPGCRGIFVATCLAELSLTMPDVRYVIDSGKLHESKWDSSLQIHTVDVRWISRDIALRRAGCAGGVEAGDYYFLGSKKWFDALRVSQPVQSTLLELPLACLYAKKTSALPTSIPELFAKTPKPPDETTVIAAIEYLKDLQALDEHGDLTALGHLFLRLGLNAFSAKLLVLGVIFQCLEPMLILASLGRVPKFWNWNPRFFAGTSSRPYFHAPGSEHISNINAFWAIRKMYRTKRKPVVAEFAKSNFLALNEYHNANSRIDWFIRRLVGSRMIPPGYVFGDRSSEDPYLKLNANSDDQTLIKALLLHCLSPQLAVKPFGSITAKIKSGVSVRKAPELSRYYSYIFAYNYSMAGKPVCLREVSTVDPLAACLLGNKIEQEGGVVTVDSWMRIRMQAAEAAEKEEEISDNLVEMHKVLNEALHTAFKILLFEYTTNNPNSSKGDFAVYSRSRRSFFGKLQETVIGILHANESSAPHTELNYRGAKDESMDMDENMDAEDADDVTGAGDYVKAEERA